MGNSNRLIKTRGTNKKGVPMPWSRTSPMDQRTQFIADYLRQSLSITELCDSYGVSRKSGYKWIDRTFDTGRPDSRSDREDLTSRPTELPTRSWRRSLKRDDATPPGVGRSSWR